MQVKALPAFNSVAKNRVKSRKNLFTSLGFTNEAQVGRKFGTPRSAGRSRVKLRFVVIGRGQQGYDIVRSTSCSRVAAPRAGWRCRS